MGFQPEPSDLCAEDVPNGFLFLQRIFGSVSNSGDFIQRAIQPAGALTA